MKRILLGLMAMAALQLTGCASIVDGSSQSLSFNSNPDGATVYLNGAAIGKTPVTISTKRQSGSQPLRFTKEGFKDVEVQANSTLNPWFLGNIVTGGLLGSTTDGLSGAAFKYEQSSYMVTLPPSDAPALSDKTSFTDRQKLVNFIVAGYANIQKELQTGDGSYLASLYSMAKISPEQTASVRKKLASLSEIYTNIPEFAERASDVLISKS